MREQGFEVVSTTEHVDEYCVRQLEAFDGRSLVSVRQEGLDYLRMKSRRKWKRARPIVRMSANS